jgi:sugar lactone lactonase YvrE
MLSIYRMLLCLTLSCSVASAVERLELIAGGGTAGTGAKATDAKLGQVFGFDRDAAGNFYIIEYTNRLWQIDQKGIIHLIAGNGSKGDKGDGGPAADALLNVPHSIAVHPSGDVYIADTGNNKIRKIDGKTGVISTFAGTGIKGHTGDGGPAKDATFGGIYCIAFDRDFSKLVLTDLDNRQIRAVDLKSGVVTLIAGNAQKGNPADGADAKKSPLTDPRAACFDPSGNIYILERGGHALRVVDQQGKIRTIAGTGQKGAGGDDGPAKQAQLNGPKHLCCDADGNVIIADTENHVIRKVDVKDGKISRIAGTGQRGVGAPGGDPLHTAFSQPHGVFIDKEGTLYICDSMNGRVFKLVK